MPRVPNKNKCTSKSQITTANNSLYYIALLPWVAFLKYSNKYEIQITTPELLQIAWQKQINKYQMCDLSWKISSESAL